MPFAALCASLVLAVASPAPGPTLAREDTMHTQVPPVLVTAPRVTLDEILDRVARGEARRDSMIHDESYRATFRLMAHTGQPGRAPTLLAETVVQVYKKRPDKVRSITLRHYEAKSEKDAAVNVHFRAGMDEEIVNFAFRPEGRRQFEFAIAGRRLFQNQLVYRITFRPRSLLDAALPSGTVWINTNEFVIVRQELDFEHSPVPIILKGVDRMVIERERVDGTWVLSRVLLRASTHVPLPRIGRTFDFSMRFDDYVINRGIDDSLFVARRGG